MVVLGGYLANTLSGPEKERKFLKRQGRGCELAAGFALADNIAKNCASDSYLIRWNQINQVSVTRIRFLYRWWRNLVALVGLVLFLSVLVPVIRADEASKITEI